MKKVKLILPTIIDEQGGKGTLDNNSNVNTRHTGCCMVYCSKQQTKLSSSYEEMV